MAIVTSLADQPARTLTKKEQTHSVRVKETQKQLGAISDQVTKKLRQRSGGICELKVRCHGDEATQRSHTTGRRIIPKKTTLEDLFHACVPCHIWLDQTQEGIRLRKAARDEGTTAYLRQGIIA